MGTHVNVGDVVGGKYRVEKVLGAGGMGMVVAATHLERDQRVALKTMLPDMVNHPQHVERFLREAEAAIRLRSEHVCRVFEVGKHGGIPYFVMEYMEGRDLADIFHERGAVPIAEAIDLVLQAIEGIAEAHALGIVHRDLKPQNLFLTTGSDGAPLLKVLDFGISKSLAGSSATKTGDMMGSPSYMAPEQMKSAKHVDARADVWALGVILYLAVTGRLPFEGRNMPAICMAVLNEPAQPPHEVHMQVPVELSAVILSCLEKQPAKRLPDVAALAAAIAPFGRDGSHAIAARVAEIVRHAREAPVEAETPHPRNSKRVLVAVLVVAVLLLGAAAVVQLAL